MVAMLQTRPPRQVEVELQAHPFTSGLHIWQRLDESQYALLSQTGPWVRHGQFTAPGVQVSGVQVPLLHVSPALQLVPLQAQPFCPGGHASHLPLPQRRPMSQVPFARQMQAAEPRWQATHAPSTHSPDEQVLLSHPQPTVPGVQAEPPPVFPPPSLLAGG